MIRSYWIDDPELITLLEHSDYEVSHISGYWYAVKPEIKQDITWINGNRPVATIGAALFLLTSTTGVLNRIDYIKKSYGSDRVKVDGFEFMRRTTWKVLNVFGIGSEGYCVLYRHLNVLTQAIIDLDYKPKQLTSVLIDPIVDQIPFYGDVNVDVFGYVTCHHDRLSEGAVKQLNEAYSHMREKYHVTAASEFQQAFKTCDITAERAKEMTKQLQEKLRKFHYNAVVRRQDQIIEESKQEIIEKFGITTPEIGPVDPATKLLAQAKEFCNMGDPEAAAYNLISTYNNLCYQGFWGAANTVKAQIQELGYTVIDGLDDTEPAQVVRSTV